MPILFMEDKEEVDDSWWDTLVNLMKSRTRKNNVATVETEQGSNWVEEVAETVIPYITEQGDIKSIWKGTDGVWKWVGTFTNNYRDEDIIPELLSSEAHRKYVTGVDNGDYPLPLLDMWHEEAWTIGKAKFVALDELDNGAVFIVAGGEFDPGMEFVAEKLSEMEQTLKMSHEIPSGAAKRNKIDYTVFDEYWSSRVTVLPKGKEANPLTSFGIIGDDMAINNNKRKAMMEALGVDEAFISKVEDLNSDLAAQAEKDRREFKQKGIIMDENTEVAEQEVPEVEQAAEQVPNEEPEQVPNEEPQAEDTQAQLFESNLAALQGSLGDITKSVEYIATQLGTLITAQNNIVARLEQLETEKAAAERETKEQTPQITSLYERIVKSVVGQDAAVVDPVAEPVLTNAPEEAKPQKTGTFIDHSPFLQGLMGN